MAIKQVRCKINGLWTVMTAGSDNTYTATLAAPNVTSYNINDGHYYPITIEASNAAGTITTVDDTDGALGSQLKLYVREITAPTITITAPTAQQFLSSATPAIKFTVVDEAGGSGVNVSSIKVHLDNKEYAVYSQAGAATSITNGYSVSYTPIALTDGSHSFYITASDNDGNEATSSTVSFTTDTVAPTLSVTQPSESGSYVSESAFTVKGTVSDSTSGVDSIKIILNSVDQGAVTISGNTFSKAVTLKSGTNSVTVTVTDKAGKSTTVTRTIILDTSAPVIASINIVPNPVNVGASYTITVTVTG